MASKRMYTTKITDSDAFIEMSASAQALYFHLNQNADDDGFNNQIQVAMLKSHSSSDDLKVLMAKNFIIRFENGVIVIKHWRMHNTLRKDRYTPTNFQEELKHLGVKENGTYTFKNVDIDSISPVGCQMVAIDKIRLGKVSIDKDSIEKETSSSIEEKNEQKDDDVFFKKFLFELQALENYPHKEEFEKIIFNQMCEFQPDKQKIIDFTKSWVIKVLPENPLENPRSRLIAWVKKHSADDIKAQKTQEKNAAEAKLKAEEKAKIEAEPTLEERIKTKSDAINFFKTVPVLCRGITHFHKELIKKFGLTNADIRG